MVKKPAASAPGIDFFGSAPVAPVVVRASGSGLKHIPLAGVQNYAILRKVEAMIKASRMLLEANIKDAASTMCVDFGIALKKKPDNFVGTENDDTATCVFAKRSSASVLTAEEQALLTEYKVPFTTDTTPDTFSIPDKYVADPVWRAKIVAALNTIPDCPTDILERTPGFDKVTINEKTIDAIFQHNDKDTVSQLLPVVTSLRVRTKSNMTADILTLLAKAGQVLGLPQMAEVMTAAANDPDSVLNAEDGKSSKKPSRKRA